MKDKENKHRQHSSNLDNCSNRNVQPDINFDAQIGKIPVVLAEIEVTTNLTANITFPEDVLEIKDIKKRLVLVQCRLLVPSDQLFIKGYVEKNIRYATPTSRWKRNSVDSDIRSLTVKVPFQCTTKIDTFITNPLDIRFNERKEFDFLITQPLPEGYPEKDELMTSDLSQYHQESTQHFNELPYCHLISSHIIEWDEGTDRVPLQAGASFEGTMRNVVEKMVVKFTIKLLQKQQVPIGGGVIGPTGPTGATGPT
ncbi:CsxC family protein, partial [Halobacillus faecis]|uniref:CsxC family protein n=1 Tax=Halobacillus faecis TaxID=360184 RepID=UPI0011BE3511